VTAESNDNYKAVDSGDDGVVVGPAAGGNVLFVLGVVVVLVVVVPPYPLSKEVVVVGTAVSFEAISVGTVVSTEGGIVVVVDAGKVVDSEAVVVGNEAPCSSGVAGASTGSLDSTGGILPGAGHGSSVTEPGAIDSVEGGVPALATSPPIKGADAVAGSGTTEASPPTAGTGADCSGATGSGATTV
jgi:hypothetical protein